jgi:alkylation response protein AidB-like acyl-CoA dehydrogenase
MLMAEIAVDLSASRAILARAAALVDEYDAAGDGSSPDEDVLAVFAEVQAAKAFVNETGTRVVDRALALSGGSGYVNGSALARAYRDVRAGAFMHPLGANRAYDVLADLSLGQVATLR